MSAYNLHIIVVNRVETELNVHEKILASLKYLCSKCKKKV